MTRILTPEKVIKYAETRLFGSNVTPNDVNHIELHNAVLPSQLEKIIKKKHGNFERVIQENGREPIYFKDGILFIPQYSGFGRGRRYEETIKAYKEIKGLPNDFFSIHFPENNPRKTYNYDFFAYDLVKKLFLEEGMNDVDTIILGPIDAVAKQAEVVKRENEEYLPYQFLYIKGKRVLNLSYVYADQGGILIDKIMREYEALATDTGKEREVCIFMFGRVGGLKDEMKRHDLVSPIGIMDESDLKEGTGFIQFFYNYLIDSDHYRGINFNPTSVINEDEETLQKAKEKGFVCIEMETREAVDAVNKANRRYHDKVEGKFGFLGYVSDVPLIGDTIEKELDSDKGEQAAVTEIIRNI
jgi:hypothetical protein